MILFIIRIFAIYIIDGLRSVRWSDYDDSKDKRLKWWLMVCMLMMISCKLSMDSENCPRPRRLVLSLGLENLSSFNITAYIVSGGALNSTHSLVIHIQALSYSHMTLINLVLLLFCNLWFNYEYWWNVSPNQSIDRICISPLQNMDSSAQQCKNMRGGSIKNTKS